MQQDGHGYGRGHLKPDPPEPQRPDVRHRLGKDAAHGIASALYERLLGIMPGEESECGISSSEEGSGAEENQGHTNKEQGRHCVVSAGASLPVNPERSWRWRPNISSFSSGSAWS
ncbi:MAG: hypothetical protein NVS3B6_06840 [Pseudarthrobacter sp.]